MRNTIFVSCILTLLSLFCSSVTAELLSEGRSVTASTELQSASFAVDNDMSTRWESSHQVDPSTITIDLGTTSELEQVVLYWEAANADTYKLEASNDGQEWELLAESSDGEFGDRTDTFQISGKFRYIRLNGLTRSDGNFWGYSIYEFQVYGEPIYNSVEETPSNVGSNIALEATISSSVGEAAFAIDDLRSTAWEGEGDAVYLSLDIGEATELTKVIIDWGDDNAASYEILASNDGNEWVTLVDAYDGEYGARIDSHQLSGSYRYLRIQGNELSEGSSQYTIWELMLFDEALNFVSTNSTLSYIPLFDSSYSADESQNWYVEEDGTIVTFASGRARSRHESEESFYTFPTFYFEHRSFGLEIHDHTPKGESLIEIYYSPEYAHYRSPECRSAYSNVYRADFNNNAKFEDTPLIEAGEDGSGQVWVCLITFDAHNGDDGILEAGEWMEFEFQQFLGQYDGDENVEGQTIYYTNTYRIQLGEPGIYLVNDNDIDESIRSGGSATATPIIAGDSVPATEIISENLSEQSLTYYVGSDGSWVSGDSDDATQATYPILDGVDIYDTYIVDSGIADWAAYMQEVSNIQWDTHNTFLRGRRLFHTDFDSGDHEEEGNPSFSELADLATDLKIENSCFACHINNGRGPSPEDGYFPETMVMKLGSGGLNTESQALPHHYFGHLLQTVTSDDKIEAEGQVAVTYEEVLDYYSDGTAYTLRKPVYSIEKLDDTGSDIVYFSPRMPQQILGLGLLEAVPESEILEWHDPDDSDEDGISGRAALVKEFDSGLPYIARFGWKSSHASLTSFTQDALNNDIGVTSGNGDADCGYEQLTCRQYSEHSAELADEYLQDLVGYLQALGAPPRDQDSISNDSVLAGEGLFSEAGCDACHRTEMNTDHRHPLAELRGNTIHPYTDLLLHDMGEELADSLSESTDYNQEWRTPPLWGLGMAAAVNGHSSFLHDGRARSIEEAILWHGGEAWESRENYRSMSDSERADLLEFLRSL
ncbi:di-heme oxidoredictase family protein [Microbulbifer sp. JMSA004]|uniref:di-heme oxidoredictase family protein n=1 Tax=Microbulbifer sp. JMSA004 TaxID=3243370 RepID=UPI00403A0EBE